MIIGVPQEVKNNEFRVGLTPGNVSGLCKQGHTVLVQRGAGEQIGLTDESYRIAGASLINSAAEVFQKAGMIVKVKEPQAQECAMLREDQILFTYLHLAPDPNQTKALLDSGATCIAYETVTAMNGALPLLAPMSEVAGRMSIQAAASHLEKTHGGLGVLMAGVPGVSPAKIVILGAGVVGRNALQMAVGMGADICIFDRDIDRLRQIDMLYGNRVRTFYSDSLLIEQEVCEADVVIGAVLLPGGAAPKLVTHEMVKKMKPGSVVVDVAIDQGGCFETSRPTTHADPTFLVDGVLHYCVANMPGAVARTSTFALTNATYPFIEALANRGVMKALSLDHHLRNGLSVHKGVLTSKPVAQAQGLEFALAEELFMA
ncbi:alanine dehydrogenase [Polynucleobacter sp. MWH-Berg-3C6]|uniref:alanine dehydrogenase n=1 Tax=Polynucleobacter sp. MWH-Berg-3C6 TaxID=1855882 RepID=UPI001C0C40AB|nr:alanine dehydrogenase [Polynucleobacter sp. MWH-Berg-3C6]MBU3551508.1 alanine dehydrogenase [Polynucleobacter sp. MWH-Berg-3C6]